ncbi:hypothetical protein A7J71_11345 [Achromobacter insolitus]|uniref:virion core protein, T7 gp14 family n=1 Tax=Achromobacter insolitus TaxID=217204 RepID=UPI0007C6A35E|nr:hypothetical protein [Achromobacter insolitus]OAE72607.1 hypothetical protein A7J71_11345 [Achromobacter insolitus]
MCTPAAAPYVMMAGAGASAAGATNSANAQRAGLNYQAEVAANNAQIAEWQAQDAIRQGQEQEQQSRLRYASTKGTQRAALAANGVALDEGSAVDILASTDYMNASDASTIQANAARAAWGYRTQGANYTDNANSLRAGASAISSGSAAGMSLLGSAGQVASSWYQYSKATK